MKRVAIIGGGISGLTALHFLRQNHAEAFTVTLYEKDNRLGGTIGTDREDGEKCSLVRDDQSADERSWDRGS